MNIAELKSKMITNQLPNFLVFTGKETGIMGIYLNQITTTFKGSIHKVETVLEATKLCGGTSIFKRNKLFIITDDTDFLKNETAWNNIKTILGTNSIILKYHNYDARLGFWKRFSNETVVFDKMPTHIVAKHISKEFGLDIGHATTISEMCDNDFFRCKLEADKVLHLSKCKFIDINTAFEQCLDTGVLCFDYNVDIFSFVDAALRRDYKLFIKMYNILVSQSEPILKLVSVLYNGFKNFLSARTSRQNHGYYQPM